MERQQPGFGSHVPPPTAPPIQYHQMHWTHQPVWPDQILFLTLQRTPIVPTYSIPLAHPPFPSLQTPAPLPDFMHQGMGPTLTPERRVTRSQTQQVRTNKTVILDDEEDDPSFSGCDSEDNLATSVMDLENVIEEKTKDDIEEEFKQGRLIHTVEHRPYIEREVDGVPDLSCF